VRTRHRLLLVLVSAGLAGAVLVAAGALALVRKEMRERFVARIAAETAFLARLAEELPADGDHQAFAARASRTLAVRVTLIAADGTVLADSTQDPGQLPDLENHLGRPEIEAARLRGSGHAVRRSATTHLDYFYAAQLVSGDGPVRYVRIALPSGRVGDVQARLAWPLVGVIAGTMVLLVGIGYTAVRRLSRPVERITAAVENAATGRAALSLRGDADTEIGRLARTVERMQTALLEKISELDAERAVLASVVSGMREGLLLVGPDRRVRLANAALREILDVAFDPEGHLVEEVVRHPTVIRGVDAVLLEGSRPPASTVRLPGSERSFELHVTPVPPQGRPESGPEALLLFFDITRLEALERVRREFVANVSHELRTPLTSIKAFVENLLDPGVDDPADARKFLEIVRRHADRMGELIEDLTDLSLIETGAVVLEPRDVDAAEIARDVIEQLRPLAESLGVRIRNEIAPPFPIRADRRRFEQMLTNLVHNAVKFNREGGEVTVSAGRDGAKARIGVEDTGVGIPADALDKVFQRFYQAHRDRSRAVGGTGLGLAIVKHLMRLHGGTVRVASDVGRGSRFTLEFPGAPAGDSSVVPLRRSG